jgi:hypothetical protein
MLSDAGSPAGAADEQSEVHGMSQRARRFASSLEEYAEEVAPGPTGPQDVSQEAWEQARSGGTQKKDFRNFTLTLSPHDLYWLLKFLETRAIASDNYLEVRQAVLFSEMIREQAKEQGF